MKIKVFLSFLLVVFFASVSFSLVPTKISYQGVLKTSSGSLLTGSYNMRFSITSDSAGNSPVWGTESHSAVSVSSGIFSVILGETTALTPSVFSSDTRYLKVEVASPSDSTTAYETMTPLTQLLSVGYALRASTAEGVVDGSIIEASIADGSVSNAKITDGTITNAKVASGNFVKQIIAGNNISISSTEANGTGIITISAESSGGSVTSVNSGAGLFGGPITSLGTLDVEYDNTTIGINGSGSLEIKSSGITSKEIAAAAPSGTKFLRYNGTSLDWTVPTEITGSFEVDDITIGFNVNTSIEVKNNGISTDKIANSAVTNDKISSVDWSKVDTSSNKVNVGTQVTGSLSDSNLAAITTAGKVSGSAVISGTIGGSTAVDTTGGIQTTGTVTAAAFKGDGSQLTGITGTDSTKVLKAGDTMTGNLTLESGKKYYGDGSALSNVVTGISSVGSSAITGRVNFAPGSNVTLTQTGQTIEVSASLSGSGINGSGTTNYVPKFSGASAIGNSTIFDDGTHVGIGTAEPIASFEVAGGILSRGTNGNTPVTGAGTRLMWIPAKGAFRAGTVSGTEWNNTNVGDTSFASGNTTIASGTSSTAMGENTMASGNYSTAIGENATAGGNYSTAIGEGVTASNTYSLAVGNQTTASGLNSTAMGYLTTASGNYSTAMGVDTISSGSNSTAMGYRATALGNTAIAGGLFLTAEANNSIVLGKGVDNTNRLNNNKANSLMVGFGGTSPILYASGEAVNGRVGIGTTEPTSKLTVAGTVEMILGSNGTLKFADGTNQTTAYTGNSNAGGWIKSGSTITSEVGINKFGVGEGAIASANNSVAIGSGNTASGISSVAMGLNSLASNTTSISIGNGTEASGLSSVALGYTTTAGGNYSTALGYFTTTGKDYSTAIGTYLTTEAIDTIVLGKGIDSDNPLRNNKANSLMVGFGGTSPILYASGEAVNGRVGIGTTEPTSKLTVAGTVEMILGSNGTLKFADGTNQTTAYTGVSASAGWIKSGSIITVESSVNKVGIGTAEPAASFEVSGGILSQGTNGITPVSGAGTRFMWIPSKNAFRAGSVDGNQWNSSNVGTNSFAEGFNTKASGNMSVALGDTTTADASSAVAFGYHALASNFASVALGNGTTASGNSSTAMGESAIASGARSTAMGFDTRASNTGSTAMGDSTIASGEYSVAMGRSTIASGEYSTAMGLATEANNTGSTAMGGHSKANGISSTAMGSYTEANGNYSFAIGDSATAVGDASFAAGQYLTTEANYTIVLGRGIGSLTSQRLKNNIADSLMVGFGGTSPILFVSGEATNGKVGVGTTEPTAKLQVDSATGYNQLRMVKSYTPGDSSTATGNVGDIAWDSNYIYIKTNDGWKRSNLIAF
ncbi:hypothetical protein A3J90_07600 [candidate division WOR-1 bacterium RIFOXYC2_FULL_37_10]|uniref:Trimeric autotransporter adhesin YadA-like head domain-containing protein n=1 Tax=candidate division WOR-1 bacterium RIFOXYB2_FULL_37_13 TaxID=1802579 RepID=A0A1F4SHI5_UNCSA|nr:MAG: hypothetical protein A2310_08740 [candidate division WOR-1 bacterium RIFOXYB2_FULL_37_13]OGC36754.1 MAG: hypothetical protein A3J90_07600 [candidate division WOR-1 bacterium RIFOXYC2_FULL_37_10]